MKFKSIILLICISCFSCNKKAFNGSIFIAGYNTNWDTSKECADFIKYQSIPIEYMALVQYGTELVIENNRVTQMYDFNRGNRSAKNSFLPFTIQYSDLDIESNIPYSIEKATISSSFLGGAKPSDLVLPHFNDSIAFQYFGTLSSSDFPNKILDFDLHLVAPIYDAFSELFLDYSTPNEPKIINGKESYFSRTFDEMDSNSKVVFEKTAIQYVKGGKFQYHFGNTGVPFFIQGPTYPRSPRTGNKMIFLASFDTTESRDQIKIKEINFKPSEGFESYFQKLDFWITGAIYIFIEPSTRTVCYFLQTT